MRVRIGSADRLLSTGRHEYVIRYRTTRQIGFFADYDELYWNATGTGWTFADRSGRSAHHAARGGAVPADRVLHRAAGRARAGRRDRRAAPGPHRVPHHAAAAGAQRAHGRRRLAEGRGDAADAGATGRLAAAGQYGARASPLIGLALVIAYYVFAWMRVGRDPPTGTIIPLFGPPAGMSAAAVRYVDQMGFDNRAFTAAIIDLGVNGHIKLVDERQRHADRASRRRQADRRRPSRRWRRSCSPAATLAAAHADQSRADRQGQGARSRTRSEAELQDKLFANNYGWSWLGLLLAIAS